jgi:hypothetical protein
MTDTAGARDDLRIAHKYIEQYDLHKIEDDLEMALGYIRRARHKDPGVTLKAKFSDKQILDHTPDSTESWILFSKALAIIHSKREDAYPNATALLKRSIQIMPFPQAYIALAFLYNFAKRRHDADAVLKEAAQQWPDDFSIRHTIDTQEADPTIGVNQIDYRSIVKFIFGLSIVAIFWGQYAGYPFLAGLGFVLSLFFGLALLVSRQHR